MSTSWVTAPPTPPPSVPPLSPPRRAEPSCDAISRAASFAADAPRLPRAAVSRARHGPITSTPTTAAAAAATTLQLFRLGLQSANLPPVHLRSFSAAFSGSTASSTSTTTPTPPTTTPFHPEELQTAITSDDCNHPIHDDHDQLLESPPEPVDGLSVNMNFGSQAQVGADLEELLTDEIALDDVAARPGDRVRVSQAWNPPPQTWASLVSVASSKGLLAVAGPDSLIIASTKEVRQTQYIPKRKDGATGDEKHLPIKVLNRITVPRLSHVAFSADESCLVIASEQGGGLAVYETDSLARGARDPAFQISTQGVAVRHVIPNPNKEADTAHLFGVVLMNGQLVIAHLKNRDMVDGSNGKVFHGDVLAACWSPKGKQIVVGLQNGTCAQIDPQGVVKAQIPAPPQLAEIRASDYPSAQSLPVTAIHWLETYKFFLAYTPFYPPTTNEDDMLLQDSVYFIAERKSKNDPFVFSKSSENPCMVPMQGQERVPACHFIQRLGAWSPKVKDLLVVVSTACSDGGTFVHLQDRDQFALTVPQDENRKITLPFSTIDDEESSAIGVALDFSSEELAPKPIPSDTDKFPQATRPLPCLFIVTTDGVLCMWWIVSRAAVQQESINPNMVSQSGPFVDYWSLRNKSLDPLTDISSMPDKYKTDEEKSAPPPAQTSSSLFGHASLSKPATPAFGQTSVFGQPSAFGQTSSLGRASSPAVTQTAAATFGQSPFSKAATPAADAAPKFGQTSFGTPSTPAPGPAQGAPAFGQTNALSGVSSAWASNGLKAAGSTTSGATFGATSKFGIAGGFGGVGAMGANNPSPWTTSNGTSNQGPAASAGFAAHANKNPFAGASGGSSLFGSGANTNNPASGLFSNAAQNNTGTSFSSGTFGKQSSTPSLFQQTSAGSTATLGSTGTSSFGQPSNLSLGATPALSNNSSGLSALEGGFKLGSTFKGDGSAKDDGPKPKDPGAGFFGADFMKGAENKKPEFKAEPGTEKQLSLEDIPESKPSASDGSGLPPDPSVFNYKKAQSAMAPPPGIATSIEQPARPTEPEQDAIAAPLPPDPSTYNHKKVMASMGAPPGTAADTTESLKDVPIAGSPPQDITHSQTFSPAGSEAGPADDGSEEWHDEDQDGTEEAATSDEGSYDEEDDNDDEDEDGEESADEEVYQPQDPDALKAFMKRVQPPSTAAPKSPEPHSSKTKSTTPQSLAQSYTPRDIPPGPVLQPAPQRNTEESPRSPSPQRRSQQQRSVTSPVRGRGAMNLPPQITATTVLPAKPIERPTPPLQPKEKSPAELADESSDRVRDLLASAIEPTKEQPQFYTHHDYVGDGDIQGIGGQIEKVFRDVNSMVDTVGLNARSLHSFLEGHAQLRKPGQRDVKDLEDDGAWTLAEASDLYRVLDSMDIQLDNGKLTLVPETLARLQQDDEEVNKVRLRTKEMRRQIIGHTDPEKRAERDLQPLSSEAAAQQSDLRSGLQNVQKLLADVEQKATMLRADITSLQPKDSKTGQATPVPTVEAVERTILKMTAMIQQKSADIDLLERQVRQLPGGVAALRLADDYEDDLASRLGGSKLLTESPRSRTPQKYPRMAANGDALGASAMFSLSRFSTPPSASMRASPSLRASALGRSGGSALGRSTGSLNASARKKMVHVTEEELDAFKARSQRRREVLDALSAKIEARGTRVVKPA